MNTKRFLPSRGRVVARTLLPAVLLAATALPGLSATALVKMVNFAFQPQFLTINAGDTVLWTNTTITGHNVVSSNNVWTAPPLFTSPGTFQFTFNNAGTYGYYCSPHHSFGMTGMITVQGGNLPPTVSLTNPPAGTTLAAPATITLAASASGGVTNVGFFSGTALLGNATTLPYQHVVSSLPAGTYDFTARATDNSGLTGTSAVVIVSVVNPSPISFAAPLLVNGNRLTMKLSVTPGLRYEVDSSTNLAIWQPFTNFVATNSVMEFSAPTTGDVRQFFQGRLLPNP